MKYQIKRPLLLLAVLVATFSYLVLSCRYYHILFPVSIPQYGYPGSNLFHSDLVNGIRDSTSIGDIQSKLEQLIRELPASRAYTQSEGKITSDYFMTRLNKLAESNQHLHVEEFVHPWQMSSVIAKVGASTTRSKDDEIVIIGCHIDSINMEIPHQDAAPGVDDNLSGVVVVLSIIEALIAKPELVSTFKLALEFHFYSAEEFGSLGSTEVFKHYHDTSKAVVGMLQLDMTGYTIDSIKADIEPHFGLVTDYASDSLIPYVQDLVKTYCTISIRETQCGKVCSDHVSGLIYGYPGIYALESEVQYSNPFRHGHKDTIDLIDFDHVWQHWALGVSFALELALNGATRPTSIQLFKFRWLDFAILEAMHDSKKFIYMTISFSALVACLYYIWLEIKDSQHTPMPMSAADVPLQKLHKSKKKHPK